MNLIEALPTVIGTAAVAPALLMLWLVIAAEERPGPPAQVWTAFLLGAASISLLGLVRAPFAAMVAAPENPWTALALRSVFGVALPEEAVKLIAIVVVSTRKRQLADPMNTVVYGAAVGLGFAAYENLAYLVQHADMWRSLAALRSVLTVPFHGALGHGARCTPLSSRLGPLLEPAFDADGPAGAAFGLRFSAAGLATQSRPRPHAEDVARRGKPSRRLQLDRLCHTAGAPRRPPPRPAHR